MCNIVFIGISSFVRSTINSKAFANNVFKTYLRLGRVISSFRKGLFLLNFAFAKFCENITLAKIFEFTVSILKYH